MAEKAAQLGGHGNSRGGIGISAYPVAEGSCLSRQRRCVTRLPRTLHGSVAKFDFWGKIQKSGVRNSMTYRLPTSRKQWSAKKLEFGILTYESVS
jgi:hypothetical protein